MTLQTREPENFRLCQWGDKRRRQACSDGERGPPSARAEIERHCVSFVPLRRNVTNNCLQAYLACLQIFFMSEITLYGEGTETKVMEAAMGEMIE